MATALVTGATGTVGSAVAGRLAGAGWDVRTPGFRDGGAAACAAAGGVDVVVHCAAERSGDLDACVRANVDAVRALVEALAARGGRGGRPLLVQLSTLSVYDDARGARFDEESPTKLHPDPDDPYGSTKAESERIILAAAARGVDAVVLRPGLILSMHPRSRWGPLAVARARAAEPAAPPLLPFPELPHVHVDNLVDAVMRAIATAAARGRAYNVVEAVGAGAAYLAAVYGAAGRSAPPIPPDAPRPLYDAQRIRRELGWQPPPRWQTFLEQLGETPTVSPDE